MNTKRFLMAFVATYLVYHVVGYLIHEVWLDPVYKDLASVFRPEEEMNQMMWIFFVTNADVTTRIFENADHRIEIGFGEGAEGNWHWFGIAPGALDMTGEWLERVLQKKPLISPGSAGSNAVRGHSNRDTSRQTSFEGEVPHK